MTTHYSFSGHETFPLRLTWLKKAVDAIGEDTTIFQSDSAIAKFGVGKNMVRSIRHWALATRVIEVDSKNRNSIYISDLGDFLLGSNGVDPYFEDTSSLWLLHWLLCTSPNRSTLWRFIFGHWRGSTIEPRNLQPALQKWLEQRNVPMPSDSTLKRDWQCLLNTYVVQYRQNSHLENVAEFPLASLGLLYESRGMVYLREGQHRGLSPEIFAYAVLDYWDQNYAETETLSTQHIMTHRGSPGQIFLLSEEQAFELISLIETFEDVPFRFDATAGIHQFYRTPGVTPRAMLERCYNHSERLSSKLAA